MCRSLEQKGKIVITVLRVLRVIFAVVGLWQIIGILPIVTWVNNPRAVTLGMAASVVFKVVIAAVCGGAFYWLGKLKRRRTTVHERVSDVVIAGISLAATVVVVVVVALVVPSEKNSNDAQHLNPNQPAQTFPRNDAANSGSPDANRLPQESTNGNSVRLSHPSDSNDIRGWQNYVTPIVEANMGNITHSPYVYLVPAADDPANAASITKVRDQLTEVVAATVLPGNMIAVVGPSSATSAQVLEAAFRNATPGSFQGVVVLFIGDPADEPAVRAAVTPSGATFKFAQM